MLYVSRPVAEIALEKVSKVYPDGTRAVLELDLAIEDGELVVFVGPSGCGKTSALRMIAGLEEITEGTIRIVPSRLGDHAGALGASFLARMSTQK